MPLCKIRENISKKQGLPLFVLFILCAWLLLCLSGEQNALCVVVSVRRFSTNLLLSVEVCVWLMLCD